MSCGDKVYCQDCLRWYAASKADQCHVPACGLNSSKPSNPDFQRAIKPHAESTPVDFDLIRQQILKDADCTSTFRNNTIAYGRPSKLNKDNNCYFYLGLHPWLRWTTGLFRMFFQGFSKQF